MTSRLPGIGAAAILVVALASCNDTPPEPAATAAADPLAVGEQAEILSETS